MQVKKFEARSMKEALEMIKTQLGPDAIILSAKEITKGFGLGGEKSIEVTAAYSESTLQKKKFVESKMPDQQKEKFQKIPARDQKEIMRKMIEAQVNKINNQSMARTPSSTSSTYKMTEKRYIDIDNDNEAIESAIGPNQVVTQAAKKAWSDMEVSSLKKEIESLKGVMNQFQNVPQNFVQAHPGAELGVNFNLSSQYVRLTEAGIMNDIAAKILMACQKQLPAAHQANRTSVENWLVKYMLDAVPLSHEMDEQFHLFVGPSGSGKTLSLIKLASHLMLNRKKRVAIISTDSIKVGADEQMKIFAQILNVPYLSVRSQQDWSHVIPHLDQLDHVLVDFAGMNLRNQEEITYMKRMSPPVFKSIRTHLVLSALSKDNDLIECAKRFETIGYQDVIFTGLDEATQHGNIYNFVNKISTELFAFGIGRKAPEDFEFATAERVIDLILKITQQHKQEMSI